MNATQHPSEQELSEFALGRLTGATGRKVEKHVAECGQCCEHLRAVPDDTFVGRFRPGTTPTDDTHETNVRAGAVQSEDGVPAELQNHPRYRIVRELGRGGMGTVYLAEHKMMERPVALKVIRSDLVVNMRAVERFRIEVRAAAKLSHPNIVTAHDAEQAGDLHFLVMEYVEGINLARYVDKRGPMSPAEAVRAMRQAARGLQHAHEKGMVHRDIKPQNLLITRKGVVKVLDFGLARILCEKEGAGLTEIETVLGTPDYIAPEQAGDSRNVDIRSDIYSLGCAFHYLLTGKPPYPDGSAMEKMLNHVETPAEPLHLRRPGVPKALSDVVAKMMAKNPGDRHQTPAELLKAMANVETEEVEPAPAEIEAEAPRLGNRRVKWIAGVAAAALVAGLAWALLPPGKKADGKGGETVKGQAAPNGQAALPAKGAVPVAAGKPRIHLLLPSQKFWNADYEPVRRAFEAAGAVVVVVSTVKGKAQPDPQGGGSAVPVDMQLDRLSPDQFDALLVIGGGGVQEFLNNGPNGSAAQQSLRDAAKAGKVVGSICMGAAPLADAGLLRNKQATSAPWVANVVTAKGGRWKDEPVVVDGSIITARDANAGPEFVKAVLKLVAEKKDAR